MSTELADLLIEARNKLGLTQQQMADLFGISRPAIGQWETGTKKPSPRNLAKLRTILKSHPELAKKIISINSEIIFNEIEAIWNKDRERHYENVTADLHGIKVDKLPFGTPSATARIAESAPNEILNAQLYFPLDVPVLGVTVGGSDHDFQFNGETVDHVRRPPGIAGARKAFATFVVGESMYPAHAEGALVFVNPDRPPSIGDDVIIELIQEDARGDQTGDLPGRSYIKRLVKRTPTKIVVMQFNPSKEIEFDRSEIRAMHRVVPWNELLGV